MAAAAADLNNPRWFAQNNHQTAGFVGTAYQTIQTPIMRICNGQRLTLAVPVAKKRKRKEKIIENQINSIHWHNDKNGECAGLYQTISGGGDTWIAGTVTALDLQKFERRKKDMNIHYIIRTFAAKQPTGHFPCPCCGRDSMDTRSALRNALSRRADIYVCNRCGVEEALEDAMGAKEKPMQGWFIARHPETFGVKVTAADKEQQSPPPLFSADEIDYLMQCVSEDILYHKDNLEKATQMDRFDEVKDSAESIQFATCVMEKLHGLLPSTDKVPEEAPASSNNSSPFFQSMIAGLPIEPTPDYSMWTDGETILCKTAEIANSVADLVEATEKAAGNDITCVTGYYDPEEDGANGESDRYTGWHYVDIG